jgi:hypothetical protein
MYKFKVIIKVVFDSIKNLFSKENMASASNKLQIYYSYYCKN